MGWSFGSPVYHYPSFILGIFEHKWGTRKHIDDLKKYSWCIPVLKEIKPIIWEAAITPEPWNRQQCWYIFEDPNVRVARLLRDLATKTSIKLTTSTPTPHFLMMGDFNLKDVDWENCSSKIKKSSDTNSLFTDGVIDCYLYQHPQEPTRQRGTVYPSVLGRGWFHIL